MRKLSMMLAFAILCLGVSDSAVAAPAPKEKETELDKFQGSWTAVKATIGGMEAPAETLKTLNMTIKGDQAVPAGDPKDVATLKIDAGKKPAEIDFVDMNKKVDRGIYRFVDSDTLEICAEIDGGERPKEFASPKESKRVLIVLKRGK